MLRPLRSSVTLAGVAPPTPLPSTQIQLDKMNLGLGVAGGALGGVVALNELAQGLRQRDEKRVMSAAADATVSAAILGALGLIGGARPLAGIGASLMGIRALQRLQKTDRPSQLGALSDLITGAICLTRVVQAPVAATVALALATTAVGVARGLHHIHSGRTEADPRLRVRGTSELIASVGASLVATGLAPFPANLGVIPGVGLLLGGVALPFLQRMPSMRGDINSLLDETERLLYPVAERSERVLDRVQARLEPVTGPLAQRIQEVFDPAHPVWGPINQAREKVTGQLMGWAQLGLDKLAETRIAELTDRAAGVIHEHLLPEPGTEPSQT
ncbi:MAG: hypothetical protein HY319_04490 [Armatimonadetes bacterium]|nr:hypothetical protein [Armatimonadota bacterium]